MKNIRGFTLLELLIYISLVSIISVVLGKVFLVINTGRANISSKTAVDSNLRFATEKIVQDLRSASAITLPSSAGATSTSLVVTVSGETITYDVTSLGRLRRAVNSSTPDYITDDTVVVNTTTAPLIFTRLENNNPVFLPAKTGVAVQFSLNIRYRNISPESNYSQTKKTTVLMR